MSLINCTDYDFLRLVAILRIIITIIKVAVPFIIMVVGVFDLLKIVTSGTPDAVKEAWKKLAYRFAAGVVIFFIPSIVGTVMGLVSEYSEAKNTYKTCIENSKDLDYYKSIKDEQKAAEREERKQKELEAAELRKEQVKVIAANEAAKKKYNNSSTSAGSYVGAKYETSDEDIAYIAKVAFCENADNDTIAYETSQMLNRFELFNTYGSSTLAQFLRDCGWYDCAIHEKDRGANDETRAIVKDVVVLGNRALPPYVDEQDCPSCSDGCNCGNGRCVCSVTTNGTTYTSASDMDALGEPVYVQDKSRIKNFGGADYTYYVRGCNSSSCDIYGYTDQALNKYKSLNGS